MAVKEILLVLIQQLDGAVFTLIAILLAVFVLLYKAGGVVKSFKDFEGKNEKIDDKIDSIKDSLSTIRATTDLLYQAHLKTVGRASPMKLTPLGEEIGGLISVEAKVDSHWEDVKQALEERNPDNPYDIQVVALDIAKSCFETIFTEEERDQIKNIAYQKGLNLLEIYPIIGITIRNKVFKERSMQLEEIDKYDPVQSKQKTEKD